MFSSEAVDKALVPNFISLETNVLIEYLLECPKCQFSVLHFASENFGFKLYIRKTHLTYKVIHDELSV